MHEQKFDRQTVWVICASCGHQHLNHRVLHEKVSRYCDDPHGPDPVWKMYRETIEALNANIRTLAGGGLRAVVEAICLDKKIADGNLQKKIEELAKHGLLTATQAELLHEERYLGNAKSPWLPMARSSRKKCWV